ncbi:MAG: demethoxyubiquinone hydroxylase family protein [Arenimonas sp.]
MSIDARLNPGQLLGSRVIKVNHAGEHGAINIYAGQIFIAKILARDFVAELQDFQSHEIRHREIFETELTRRNVRRCRSYHFCGLGGFTLGLITALFGRQAIAATTVAVESVVLKHLHEQIRVLEFQDKAAVAAISEIIRDEQDHHDRSASYVKAGQFWPKILMPIVAVSTNTVIWLGMHL